MGGILASPLLAQFQPSIGAGWSFGGIMIAIIVVLAVLGIAYAVVKYFGIPVPQVVWTILGIVLVAALAIIAIRFLLSL